LLQLSNLDEEIRKRLPRTNLPDFPLPSLAKGRGVPIPTAGVMAAKKGDLAWYLNVLSGIFGFN